jgi:hypothetical protein
MTLLLGLPEIVIGCMATQVSADVPSNASSRIAISMLMPALPFATRETADLLALKPVSLLGDAGGMRVRHALEKLLVAQRQAVAADKTPETLQAT